MRHRTTLTAALASATLVLVGACDGGEATGSPTASQSKPAAPSSSNFGAPTVENPLETSSIDTKPCNVVTPDQIEQLPGSLNETFSEDTAAKSKSCVWLFDDERGDALGNVTAGTVLETGATGLQTYYKANEQGDLGYFEELPPIAGYPAVAYERTNKNEGDCTMAVGVRDDMAYLISVGLREEHPNYVDPCTLGTKIAEFAVEYLQGRQ